MTVAVPASADVPYTKVFITGRAEAKAALAAKLTAARVVDEAKMIEATTTKEEPIEGEVVVRK